MGGEGGGRRGEEEGKEEGRSGVDAGIARRGGEDVVFVGTICSNSLYDPDTDVCNTQQLVRPLQLQKQQQEKQKQQQQ